MKNILWQKNRLLIGIQRQKSSTLSAVNCNTFVGSENVT